MDPEIKNALDEQREILKVIYDNTQKIKKFIRYSLIGSLIMFVLPMILIIIAIPILMSTIGDYSDVLNMLL